MKKTLAPVLLFSLFILTATFLTPQEDIYDYDEKKINVLGSFGLATTDFRGPFVDIAVEMQVSRHLFGQLGFDYYLDPFNQEPENTDFSAYGFSLYGVYKIYPRERLNLFAKAGCHYSTIRQRTTIDELDVSVTQSDFGFAGGIGLEYLLSRKLSLILGGTIKYSFANEAEYWLKLYCGASFRLK